jgi:SAM-dependent methyltransferase
LESRAEFRVVDADKQLPFPESSFDAITCIDAINHLTDRQRVVADWARLLKPGGRVLFTNPAVVTGPLTNAEIAVRGLSGFYLFVPSGYDERVIMQCGLRVVACEDRTPKLAEIAERRKSARESRSSALRRVEGDVAYENRQKFFSVVANLAREARLSRYVYVAEKTSGWKTPSRSGAGQKQGYSSPALLFLVHIGIRLENKSAIFRRIYVWPSEFAPHDRRRV